MVDLESLRLTPEQLAEREARHRRRRERIAEIAARVAPSRKAQSPSRADLHALLDACLDLAEMREPEKWPAALWSRDDDAVEAARLIGRALARGAFGWTEPETPRAVRHVSGAMAWFELEHAPVQWCEEMAGRLERSPHVLPARMVRALADALRRLSDGSATARVTRRGCWRHIVNRVVVRIRKKRASWRKRRGAGFSGGKEPASASAWPRARLRTPSVGPPMR